MHTTERKYIEMYGKLNQNYHQIFTSKSALQVLHQVNSMEL